MLIERKYLSISSKAEVGYSTIDEDATEENSSGRPDVDTITATTIHISIQIALDSIGNTVIGHGKESTVGEKRLSMYRGHVEGIATQHQTNQWTSL